MPRTTGNAKSDMKVGTYHQTADLQSVQSRESCFDLPVTAGLKKVVPAAACASLDRGFEIAGLVGLTRSATILAAGITWCDVKRVFADIDTDHGDFRLHLAHMACSSSLGAPCQLPLLAGPERGRTIPLPDLSQAEIPRCGEP